MATTGKTLTEAQTTDLAWIALTGWHRPRVHAATRCSIHAYITLNRSSLRYEITDPEVASRIEGHPMVRKARALIAQGYALTASRSSRYLFLQDPSRPRSEDRELVVYADGRVY